MVGATVRHLNLRGTSIPAREDSNRPMRPVTVPLAHAGKPDVTGTIRNAFGHSVPEKVPCRP